MKFVWLLYNASMTESIPFVRLIAHSNEKPKQTYKNFLPELLFVLGGLLSAYFWGQSLSSLAEVALFGAWLVVYGLLLALMFTNLRTFLLPDVLIKPLAVAVIVFQLINATHQNDISILWSALFGALILGGVPYILFQISSGRWIGGGDTKLGFVAGLLLGWKLSLVCLALMVLLTGSTFLFAYIAGRITKSEPASRAETGIIWVLAIYTCVLLGHHILK